MCKKSVKGFIFNGIMPSDCCHASNLALLLNGDVLAAWFGGSKEGADDVVIWCSRRERGKWCAPYIVVDDGEGVPYWNPVLFTKDDGAALLFYKVGRTLSEWSTKMKISQDNGTTWTKAMELVPGDRGGRGPVRNKVIKLFDGTMLAPGSTEKGIWKAFTDKSADGGNTWEKSNEIFINGLRYDDNQRIDSDIPVTNQSFKGKGVIQPTLWESKPGSVHMLLRSSEGKIYRSDSSDSGQHWTEAYPTEIPNNNSGIDLAKLHDGSLVLAYNPVGVNWGPRTPLVLSISRDNGETWGEELVLENGQGEYSYPAIICDGNKVFVSYTWRRKKIGFWEIDID